VSGPAIEVVAAVIRDNAGRVLTVRKAGASRFMLPGGKREAGEDDLTALARELREELGIVVTVSEFLGQFEAPAANEPGLQVVGAIYAAETADAPVVAAEIAEMLWLDPAPPYSAPLAPLLEVEVLPRLGPGTR
jgi:8-oxo-dGTP diphosphatase